MSVRDRPSWEIGSSGAFQLQFNLVFELRFILNAVIAGQATHYALPVVEGSGHVLARNAGHGGEIILPDLLMDDDPARPAFSPEIFRQLEHRPGNPAFERKEATGKPLTLNCRDPSLQACDFGTRTHIFVPETQLFVD
jgi:hypothetical protein